MSEPRPESALPVWHLYLLETAGGALYTGITTDVERRLTEHAAGRGAKALRGKGPLRLRHRESVGTQGEALRLEAEIKRLSATRKRAWLARRLALGDQGQQGQQGASMHPLLVGIQLVAFDLDGTLIDSVPDLALAVDAALVELGLPAAGEARVRDWVGNGSLKLMERALRFAVDAGAGAGKSDPATGLLERAHCAFLAHYGRDPGAHTRLYPGARECLDALRSRGLTLALVTNKPHAFIAPLLEGLGIAEHFSLCLGGDSLPEKKPHPAPLRHLAVHFDVPPEACLMVGDSRHDIAAGKAAGFRTLAVPYGYNHGEPVRQTGPDDVVESLAELV
ncbi:MAG: phosphoglycolate phosphatase [Pseudomonadota bacterium]